MKILITMISNKRKYVEEALCKQFWKNVQHYLFLKLYHEEPIIFHVPNGGFRDSIEGSKFKQMGVTAGVADYVAINSKSTLFIEFKSPTGSLVTSQKAFQKKAKKLGIPYVIVKSAQEGIQALVDHGILK